MDGKNFGNYNYDNYGDEQGAGALPSEDILNLASVTDSELAAYIDSILANNSDSDLLGSSDLHLPLSVAATDDLFANDFSNFDLPSNSYSSSSNLFGNGAGPNSGHSQGMPTLPSYNSSNGTGASGFDSGQYGAQLNGYNSTPQYGAVFGPNSGSQYEPGLGPNSGSQYEPGLGPNSGSQYGAGLNGFNSGSGYGVGNGLNPEPLSLPGESSYLEPSVFPAPSPGSSSTSSYDGYSEGGARGSDQTRQRRRRVNYSELTEEQKYNRIRELNNEASRTYREKKKDLLKSLEKQLSHELQRNRHLQEKAGDLKKALNKVRKALTKFKPDDHNFNGGL